MNEKKSKVLFAILIGISIGIAIPNPVHPQDGKGGQAGAFLRIGVGSKAMAMGRAFTGLANDVSSIYWNPAGIGMLRYK